VKTLWPLGYVFVVTGILYALGSDWAYDDPFITYRYAQNIARGTGFVYNPGEQVLSTTTPLFALLLAGLSLLWGDIPRLSNLIGAFSLACGAVFIWRLAQAWQTGRVGWLSLLLYPAFPLLLITLGSEIPLYLAFCLGAFAFYAGQNYRITAIFAALATLTRPEGMLVAAVLGCHYLLIIKRPIPWMAVTLFLAPTLLWSLFAWSYFGSPIPATLAAKHGQGAMPISQGFPAGMLAVVVEYAQSGYVLLVLLNFLIVLLGWGVAFWNRRQWILFLAWPALYFCVFTLLGVTSHFWYYASFVPGFVVSTGLGIDLIQWKWREFIARLSADRRRRNRMLAAPMLLASPMLLAALPGLLVAPILFKQLTTAQRLLSQPDPRLGIYRAVGQWLAKSTPGDATVGALEVGIIGYYAARPMIDFAGLLQPATGRQLASSKSFDEVAQWAIEHYRPAYIVLPSGPAAEYQGEYIQGCTRVQRFPGASFGYPQTLDIFACKRP
jgi:hypothetical protein